MIGPFVIDRSHGSLPWVVFELPLSRNLGTSMPSQASLYRVQNSLREENLDAIYGRVLQIESPTPSKRREKVAMDILVATQISREFFGIIRKTWERFHEMLIQQAERASREHEVTSKRKGELQASYIEGIRLSFACRQMVHLKVVVDEPRMTCRHLDFPV